MNNRILVTYASRAGSTAGVAEAIGRSLVEVGAQVDVLPMKKEGDHRDWNAIHEWAKSLRLLLGQ